MAHFLSFIILAILGCRLCMARDTLLPGSSLSGNQTLVSKNGVYELGVFSKPNSGLVYLLALRFVKAPEIIIWTASTNRNIIWNGMDPSTWELKFSSTGNLVLTQYQTLIWSSNSTSRDSVPVLAVLLDTGNFIVKEQNSASNIILWQSFNYPTIIWLPGAPLGFNKATGENIHLKYGLDKDPHSSLKYLFDIFSLEIDPSRARGFIIKLADTNSAYYGTFPEWLNIVNYGEHFVTFNDTKQSHIYMQLVPDGFVKLYGWFDDPSKREIYWSSPNSMCDYNSSCGPFSLCLDSNSYLLCSCPDGFEHNSTGCSPIVSLNCHITKNNNYLDNFSFLNNLKRYPGNPQDLAVKTETECKAACLSNCSCSAYAYQNKCSLWFGELYNTVQKNDSSLGDTIYIRYKSLIPQHNRKTLKVIMISVIGVMVLTAIGLLFCQKNRVKASIFNRLGAENCMVAYSYAQMKNITRNFTEKLGEGGFGTVFKGSLSNSTLVAVKKMKTSFGEEKQFRTEVQTIGMIQHINLVRLLGLCSEGTKRLLVYEYMPNGSLDSYLFSNSRGCLDWNIRYQIMVGIARGLTYLHQDCIDCIIHCDIKPENVLLDANFCPKIADFGMSKLLDRDFSKVLTTTRGTIGYLAPEWIFGQLITEKADVYSFGMVLFEIISGRRNIEKLENPECTYFPLYAAIKTNQGEVSCLLDSRLQGNANMEELSIVCKVACWCIQEIESDRPSMRQVVQLLEGVVEVSMPPVPSFLQRLADLENNSMYSVVG